MLSEALADLELEGEKPEKTTPPDPKPAGVPGQGGQEPPPEDRARAAECGAAKTTTTHTDPPFDIKHIHRLLNTLRDVNESALLQKIRIDEHSGIDVFEKAAEELRR